IIGKELAHDAVSFIQYQLEGNDKDITPFFNHVKALDAHGAFHNAEKGLGRYGAGDDWPLWVPEKRRTRPATRGRDEIVLRRATNYAFGGLNGVRKLPTTILLCQLPEILASHPLYEDYRPEVYQILQQVSRRLQENDRRIFQSTVGRQ